MHVLVMRRTLAAVAVMTLLGVGAGVSPTAAQPLQYTNCDFSVGGSPVALATDDFNRDGNPDLAVVDQSRNQVIVILTNKLAFQSLNCGNPGDRVDVAVGASPVAIAAGDLDRNLTIDLAVATQAGISILRSNAAGVFTAQQPINGGADPQAIAIADVTGDARADIVVGNGSGNSVTVLRGAADNEFAFAQAIVLPVGAPVSFLIAQDLNLDSDADIAAGSTLNGQIRTFLHDSGSPSMFLALPSLAVGVAPRAMVAVDLTRDAVPDLVVVGGGTDGRLTTYVNQLPENETQPFVLVDTETAIGSVPTSVAAGNIDDDFDPDLVVSNQDDDTVPFFFGAGDGTVVEEPVNCLIRPELCLVGDAPQSVVLADVDDDGTPDVVTANQGAGSLTFLLSSHPATPTLTPIPTVTASRSPTVDNGTATSTPTVTPTLTPTDTPSTTPTPIECFVAHAFPGCNNTDCEACVCDPDQFCCTEVWDDDCVQAATGRCSAPEICNFVPTLTPTITETPSKTERPTRTETASPTHSPSPTITGTRPRTPTNTPTMTGPIPTATRTPTETLTPSLTPTETPPPTKQPSATPRCVGEGMSKICTSGDTCALTPNTEHSPGMLLFLLPGLLAIAVRRMR